jgi:hypothetical protein
MCISSGASAAKKSADEQRAEEEARQGRIRTGKTNIEDKFSGFDDAFYDNRRKSYLDYANPQYDNQLKDATRELTLALARSGLLNSSVKSRRFADLQREADMQKRAIGDKALDFSNQARKAIGAAKADLLTQNQSLADPTLIANQAANRAEAMTALPPYSPLGQLFASATEGLATQAELERRGKNRYTSGLFNFGGSSRNVNS